MLQAHHIARLHVVSLQAKNTIQVMNNGNGVPVEMHREEKVYVPELIFGHLLTSSNYDDTEKKVCALSVCDDHSHITCSCLHTAQYDVKQHTAFITLHHVPLTTCTPP